MKRMPDHPLHQKLKDRTKNRLKRKNLNHLVKEQQKEHADTLTTDAHLCEKLNPNSWPPETLHAEIRKTILGITSKENQSEPVLRALALEEIDKHYPAASWTYIYTDGSAENATRNVGCDIYINRQGKPPLSVSAPGGYCAQTTELKSWHCCMPQKTSFRGKRCPRKQSPSQTHYQHCKPSCLVNLTQRKRSSQRTLAPSLKLPV